MKYKKKARRLLSRQAAYDALVAKDINIKISYRRPGSFKKPL